MLNFDYLKNIPELSELHPLCDLCEQRQFTEPDSAAINARKTSGHDLDKAAAGEGTGKGMPPMDAYASKIVILEVPLCVEMEAYKHERKRKCIFVREFSRKAVKQCRYYLDCKDKVSEHRSR